MAKANDDSPLKRRIAVWAVGVAAAAVVALVIVDLVKGGASAPTVSSSAQRGGMTAHTANANPAAPAPRHLTQELEAQLETIPRDASVVVATAGDTRETASYADEITAWLLAHNYANLITQREDAFPRFFGEKIGPEEGEYRITIGDQQP